MSKAVITRVSGWGQAVRLTMAGLALAALASCSPVVRNHGYVPSEEELALIEVGAEALGEGEREGLAEALGCAEGVAVGVGVGAAPLPLTVAEGEGMEGNLLALGQPLALRVS